MSLDHEKSARYRQVLRSESGEAENELSGAFWVVCPEDGVQVASRVVQWSKAASVIMREDAGDEWFMNDLYTSGACTRCNMSLPVSREKPVV